MPWIDITMPLQNNIAHWPGDTPFSYSLAATIKQTGSVNVGTIEMSTHTGTHADAPFHYKQNGSTIDQMPLDLYIGEAFVFNAIGASTLNRSLFEQLPLNQVSRLLVKTKEKTTHNQFPVNIPAVTPDAASYLAEKGVQLLGVDMPSVDPVTSKELDGHLSLDQASIAILENLVLDHVEEGFYELIALPLLISHADGSPVRAVIRPLERSPYLNE